MKGALSSLLARIVCLGIVFGSLDRVQGQTTMTLIATNTFSASSGVGTRSGPVLGRDGTVYIASFSSALGKGSLYALYLSNGVFYSKWTNQFTAGGKIDSSPTLSPDDSTVYIGSYDFNLYAINTADGSGKWTNTTAGYIRTTPAIGNDGTVYFVSQFNDTANPPNLRWQVCAVSPSNGSVLWKFPTLGTAAYYGNGTPNLTIAADGTIYAGCITATNVCQSCNPTSGQGSGVLYAIGVTNGTPFQKWQFPPANSATEIGGINHAPTLDGDGTLYFGTYGDANVAPQFFALNPDGSTKWASPLTGSAGRFDSSPTIGSDGTVYVGENMNSACDCHQTGNNGVVFALSPVDGSIKWAFTNSTSSLSLVTSFESSPALSADGTLYIGSDDLIFRAFNSANGSVVSTSTPCGSQTDPDPGGNVNLGFESSPVIAPNGVVYVGSWDGNLYAFCYETNVGLATSFWPMFRENRRHSGDAVDNRWTELPFPSATIVALPYTGQAQGVTNWAAAYAVNGTNMIAGGNFGSFSGSANEHMVYWYNNAIHDFAGLSQGKDSEGLALNDSGLVVGWGDDSSGVQWGVWRSLTSLSMQKLTNPLSTWTSGIAEGANNAGQIVGYANNPQGYPHAVFWASTAATGLDLETLLGNVNATNSYAFGINGTGWVVGKSHTSGGVYHGFLTLSNTALVSGDDLGTMSGSTSDYSAGYAINGVGQITGGSGTSSGSTHAFLKYPFSGASAGYQDLGTLGFGSANGTAISGRGHVGGVMSQNSGGFLYVPGWANPTNVYNFLSSSDKANWSIKGVFGVNHQGWIVGWGLYGSSQQKRAFAIYPNN